MTITEFLLARVDEDEYEANHRINQETARAVFHHDRWYRVLAECAAKRAIIHAHQFDHTDGDSHICQDSLVDDSDCPVLRALTSVYADHPDYDEAWRA